MHAGGLSNQEKYWPAADVPGFLAGGSGRADRGDIYSKGFDQVGRVISVKETSEVREGMPGYLVTGTDCLYITPPVIRGST